MDKLLGLIGIDLLARKLDLANRLVFLSDVHWEVLLSAKKSWGESAYGVQPHHKSSFIKSLFEAALELYFAVGEKLGLETVIAR